MGLRAAHLPLEEGEYIPIAESAASAILDIEV